jgi:hypothetical protein
MNFITDTNGTPLSSLPLTLVELTDSAPVVIRVPCAAGLFLASPGHESAQVLARRSGTSDAYADLSTDPLDLSPYAGTVVEFDLKIHTLAVSASVFAAIPLVVTANP